MKCNRCGKQLTKKTQVTHWVSCTAGLPTLPTQRDDDQEQQLIEAYLAKQGDK
jgi:hypothetical protein